MAALVPDDGGLEDLGVAASAASAFAEDSGDLEGSNGMSSVEGEAVDSGENAEFEVERERAEGLKLLAVSVEQPRAASEGYAAGGVMSRTPTVFQVSWKTTQLERFQREEDTIQRRYNDFVWLREQLVAAQPGCIVPPLPDKSIFNSSPDFLEKRRASLDLFIKRVCIHPVLRGLPCVTKFLESEAAPSEPTGAEPESKPAGGFFGSLKTAIGAAVAGSLPESLGGVQVQETSNWFEEQKKDVAEFYTKLWSMQKATGALRAQYAALTDAYNVFSESCGEFARCEAAAAESDMSVNNGFQKLGEVTHDLVGQNKEIDYELVDADERLQDYVRVVESVRQMLARRDAHLGAYQRVERQLTEMKENVNSKATDSDISAVEARLARCKAEFEGVSDQARNDLKRFYRTKGVDMRRLLGGLKSSHLKHSQGLLALWQPQADDRE
jgi:sorting nexin-1/2